MVWRDYIPVDVADLYEVHDYHHAAAILSNEFPSEFRDVCTVLRKFRITRENLLGSTGYEGARRKFSDVLGPLGWGEASFDVNLAVDGAIVGRSRLTVQHLKGRVAFCSLWSAEHMAPERDLCAFNRLFAYDQISVGVLVVASCEIAPCFESLIALAEQYDPACGATTAPRLGPDGILGCSLGLRSESRSGCPVLVVWTTPKLLLHQTALS
ncbi:MAG: BglII/BstYI family type II restriction endonuclease [Candidatus Zixiibacteriota bacterium]